jgi:hypothetical protein
VRPSLDVVIEKRTLQPFTTLSSVKMAIVSRCSTTLLGQATLVVPHFMRTSVDALFPARSVSAAMVSPRSWWTTGYEKLTMRKSCGFTKKMR